ncbi:hypothetical protein R1flu_003551 [Riccia fluitans]|uniref:Uncharacterized protein n=1 Tax=Riccia fluitans TaxID=41844 RepID=A0ABD1Y9C2_9MARC
MNTFGNDHARDGQLVNPVFYRKRTCHLAAERACLFETTRTEHKFCYVLDAAGKIGEFGLFFHGFSLADFFRDKGRRFGDVLNLDPSPLESFCIVFCPRGILLAANLLNILAMDGTSI